MLSGPSCRSRSRRATWCTAAARPGERRPAHRDYVSEDVLMSALLARSSPVASPTFSSAKACHSRSLLETCTDRLVVSRRASPTRGVRRPAARITFVGVPGSLHFWACSPPYDRGLARPQGQQQQQTRLDQLPADDGAAMHSSAPVPEDGGEEARDQLQRLVASVQREGHRENPGPWALCCTDMAQTHSTPRCCATRARER